MSNNTVGIVLMGEKDKNMSEIINKVKVALDDFYQEKLQASINALPNVDATFKDLSSYAQKEFKEPVIDFRSPDDSSAYARLSFISTPGFAGTDRTVTIHTRSFIDDVKDYLDTDKELPSILFSMGNNKNGHAIIERILEQFGDEHPSYMVKEEGVPNQKTPGNLTKIGSAPEITPIQLSPAEPEEEPVQRPRRKM